MYVASAIHSSINELCAFNKISPIWLVLLTSITPSVELAIEIFIFRSIINTVGDTDNADYFDNSGDDDK